MSAPHLPPTDPPQRGGLATLGAWLAAIETAASLAGAVDPHAVAVNADLRDVMQGEEPTDAKVQRKVDAVRRRLPAVWTGHARPGRDDQVEKALAEAVRRFGERAVLNPGRTGALRWPAPEQPEEPTP